MEVAKGFTDVLYTTMVLLFNEIFVPVMTEILSLFYEKAMYVLSHSVSILAYFFLITVCKILDSLETMIGIFAGTENVIVDNKPMTFMEMVFNQDAVSKGFLMITLVAVGICFLFTIFAIVRSMSSSTLENKNPISQVLKDAMKACVSFDAVELGSDKADQSGHTGRVRHRRRTEHGPLHLPDSQLKSRKGGF